MEKIFYFSPKNKEAKFIQMFHKYNLFFAIYPCCGESPSFPNREEEGWAIPPCCLTTS
jgi:hypothetical protein